MCDVCHVIIHRAKQLRGSIQKKMAGIEEEKKRTIFTEEPPEVKLVKDLFSPKLQLWHCDEEEIARQLTLLEFGIYANIQPSELLNLNWSKPKHRHK